MPFGDSPQGVLHDDDRAIDDQAEIQRAQTHQIAGDAQRVHPDGAHQNRKRNHERGNGRGTNIAEDQKQRGDDEQRADRKIFRDGRDGRVDQL